MLFPFFIRKPSLPTPLAAASSPAALRPAQTASSSAPLEAPELGAAEPGAHGPAQAAQAPIAPAAIPPWRASPAHARTCPPRGASKSATPGAGRTSIQTTTLKIPCECNRTLRAMDHRDALALRDERQVLRRSTRTPVLKGRRKKEKGRNPISHEADKSSAPDTPPYTF